MDKITNNFFHSQTNSTTELGHSPPFLDLSRKLLVNGFLIMINYIYIQLYNLQGWFVMVSDCEELVGVTHSGKNYMQPRVSATNVFFTRIGDFTWC